MSIYKGSQKIKDIYFGTPNTNCLTHIPNDINLTLDPLNVGVTGTPTISNGVASGFSVSNYLTLPKVFNPQSSKWEIVIQYTPTATPNPYASIFGNSSNTDYSCGVHIFHYSNNKIGLECTSTNTSWNVVPSSTLTSSTLKTGQAYWIKVEFTGSAYNLYLSTDNKTWVKEITVNSSTPIKATATQAIGINYIMNNKYPITGSINLSQSYIKINGSTWWKGGTGNLTLKKGSKVYVPNGAGKFDEVVIASDITTNGVSYTGDCFYFVGGNGTYLVPRAISQSATFTTIPTSSITGIYEGYCSEDNKMYLWDYQTMTWRATDRSLPIGIINLNSTTPYIRNINQVFNGFGYIGSTVFALPNVKGLASNGNNEDGTYKSVEFTISNPTVFTDPWEVDGNLYYGYHYDSKIISNYFRDELVYDRKNNLISYRGSVENICIVAEGVVQNGGKITSLTINPVQSEKTGRKISRVYKGSTLVYGYAPNKVLFESSTAGTATVNIEHSGYYEITVVGGGSGGAFEYSAKYADGAAGGGSGGGLIGVAYLQAGTYSVTVGAGGAGAWDNNSREWISASAGSSSSFGSIVTANGGTAATARYNNGSQTAGQGGTVSYTASAFRSVSLNKQGNAGATATNASTSATYSGGESVYGGYGAGGKAQYGGAYAGGTGYVKVVAI